MKPHTTVYLLTHGRNLCNFCKGKQDDDMKREGWTVDTHRDIQLSHHLKSHSSRECPNGADAVPSCIAERMVPPVLQWPKGGEERQQS